MPVVPLLQKLYPTMQPPPDPAAPYGLRPDGTPKGKGFMGELKRPDGGVMTEYSIGVNLGGKEMDIPTIVPTLTKKELDLLLKMKDGDKLPESIVQKAVDHAKKRLAEGKNPFADPTDERTKKDTP